AMRLLPEARLVVEDGVAHALFGEMPDPAELELGVHLHVRVVRIVVRDARAVEADAVARVGPEGIGRLLRTVLRDREAGQPLATRAELRHPADGRNGDHRLGALIARHGYEVVDARARRGAFFAERFEVPVRRAIARVRLPVIARRGVTAPAIERSAEAGGLSVGREGA